MKKSMLEDLDFDEVVKPKAAEKPADAGFGVFLPLDAIEPDPDQPRRLSADSDTSLQELAGSILQHGILQPIVVSALGGGKYRIVSGERRWRAATIAAASGQKCARKGYDLNRIPVVIQNPENESDRLEMQMVENLAREDMSDLDTGRALNKLLTTLKVSKAELARRIGRSETWVKTLLAKASDDAEAVAQRIGVPLDKIGANDVLRLISWSKDPDKQVVLDDVAAAIRGGQAYSRSLIDAAEARYDVYSRFPSLRGRQDLSNEDLDTFLRFWSSAEATQRAVAQRVLDGMGLAEAMAVPADSDLAENEVPPAGASPAGAGETGDEPPLEASSAPVPLEALDSEFDADDDEVNDASLVVDTKTPTLAQASTASVGDDTERRKIDAAGLQMENTKPVLAEPDEVAVLVRVPGEIVRRLLEKAGIEVGLEVDADVVLEAIRSLV